jgi:hypothetical protein
MNTLLEDLDSPLCQVDRSWIRRPVLFFVFIILFIPCAIFGLLNGILDLTGEVRKCW